MVDCLVIAIGLVLAGVGFWAYRQADLVRWMRKLRPMPIAYAKDGMRCKFVGTVVCEAPIVAPVRNELTVAWSVHVTQEGHRQGDSSSSAPRTVLREQRSCDFFLEDGSGRAVVRFGENRPILLLRHQVELQSWITQPQVAAVSERLLQHHDVAVVWQDDRGTVSFAEAALEVGDRVAVIGFCRWDKSVGDERILVIEPESGSNRGLVVCDDEQAIRVNPRNPAPGFRLQ